MNKNYKDNLKNRFIQSYEINDYIGGLFVLKNHIEALMRDRLKRNLRFCQMIELNS